MIQGCHRMPLAWLAIAAALAIGCQPPGPSHDEEHDHFPPHWPETIFGASARLSALADSPRTVPDAHGVPVRQELVDLMGWLPMLAADSDLDRSSFDRIDSWSTRIHERWQRTAEQQEVETLLRDSEARELIAWLADVCRQEQARIDQLQN